MDPIFLTLDEILSIHGGRVRDFKLLQFAVGIVEATFGGAYLHGTIFEMAAAYLFHISRNHPFVDGNKRTALACALAFLQLNGKKITAPPDDLYDLAMGVAEGKVTKAAAAVCFEKHA